jgi:glucoamylase
MAKLLNSSQAFGWPGIEPRWTRSAKDAVGTAYSTASRVWFTVSSGIVNEVYFPTIDRPQIRDLQFLITDGKSFFHDERRYLDTKIEYLAKSTLGFRMTSSDREGRYRIVKELITDPHESCLLLRARLEADESWQGRLHLFVLVAPHLDVGGWGNYGNVGVIAGREILTAHKNGTWLAMTATTPFIRRSCGFVGNSDGWQDLADNFRMDWSFEAADNGNIALCGELDLSHTNEFTVGLAFGDGLQPAVATLFQSLGVPFSVHRDRFIDQWSRASHRLEPLEAVSGDGGVLYRISHSLLLAHEDKAYPGAIIASLSIPWGEAKGDEDLGGYHLVWTRDMVKSATGLLACGNSETALRALIYLACAQLDDGGFYQNFWIDGDPFWRGIQLDEVSFPITLAWTLQKAGALRDFDPYPIVLAAARYLIDHGPATPQERWEENSGYSPSTLAANISGLTCAAHFARERGDPVTANFIQDYADFLESHIEAWTVTTDGTLVPGISRHFIRINPVDVRDPQPDEDPNQGILDVRNQAPGERYQYPAKDIIDHGFLELVRYGIRKPGDTLIEDSLQVVDATLRIDTPAGPCWRRYNHDGYGQRADGGPFQGWGIGRPWPLLTGERGHYEFAAGRDIKPYIRAMEGFASAAGLLPEQIWDRPDHPGIAMYFGEATGAAMPLMWAHSEYIKLLRSARDGKVFELVEPVFERYCGSRRELASLEIWKFNRQPRAVRPGVTLRILALAPFMLRWTSDEWSRATSSISTHVALGFDYVDIPVALAQTAPIRFTFFWPKAEHWEGRDFSVAIAR